MLRSLCLFFVALSLIFLVMIFKLSTNVVITDYHETFVPCYDKNNVLCIAIREYYVGKTPYFLVVNPYTFATRSAPVKEFKSRKISKNEPGYFSSQIINNTPFMRSLSQYTMPPYKMENQGITAANHAVNGQFLTIDMCPSVKPFETKFYQSLVAQAELNHKPIPIAIAITGLWMLGHPQEFNWLIQQQKKNKLQITWINHSFSHVYYHDLPFTNNFLTLPQINFESEVLESEKVLLEHHQNPSVFFRFPGLVSNQEIMEKLKKFSLIPIGSDAWLAKDQPIRNGSIILVHGNSNEPKGIEKILPFIQHSQLKLLPLSQAF